MQKILLSCCITQAIFLFTCKKVQTRLIYYSCVFWSLPFRYMLNHIHHLIISIKAMYFYKKQVNHIKCYV